MASGGCESPDDYRLNKEKSGHLRTPLAERIPLVHAIDRRGLNGLHAIPAEVPSGAIPPVALTVSSETSGE